MSIYKGEKMETKIDKRNYSLDVIKIIATILIVFHHYQQVTGTKFQLMNFYDGNFQFGFIVELFFIISGYLTFKYIKKIENGELFKDFYLKKAKRLLPLVAISVVVSAILQIVYKILYSQWYFVDISLFGIISNSLGIQARMDI